MVPNFIIVGTAATLRQQLDDLKARMLGIVPPIREGGPFDGRAPRQQDSDGFAKE